MEKASCCDHPRICQKTIKKYKTVSPEPLFQTEYFNRCYQNSFIPKTIADWNSLPSDVIQTPTTDCFSEAVWRHLTP
jgi:hypothetical protein